MAICYRKMWVSSKNASNTSAIDGKSVDRERLSAHSVTVGRTQCRLMDGFIYD